MKVEGGGCEQKACKWCKCLVGGSEKKGGAKDLWQTLLIGECARASRKRCEITRVLDVLVVLVEKRGAVCVGCVGREERCCIYRRKKEEVVDRAEEC